MIITILILIYVILLNDIFIVFGDDSGSTLLLSSTLTILLSWQVNTTWGIIMLCILSLICLFAIIKVAINSVKKH